MVSYDFANGRLVRCREIEALETVLWALYPLSGLLSAPVSAYLEYLKQTFPLGTADELAAYLEE